MKILLSIPLACLLGTPVQAGPDAHPSRTPQEQGTRAGTSQDGKTKTTRPVEKARKQADKKAGQGRQRVGQGTSAQKTGARKQPTGYQPAKKGAANQRVGDTEGQKVDPRRKQGAKDGPTPVERAITDLERKVDAGGVTPADLGRLRAIMAKRGEGTKPDDPRIQRIRKHLTAEVSHLEQRAQKVAVTKADLARIEQQMIDERVMNILSTMQRKSATGQLEEGDYERLRSLVRRRAIAAKKVHPNYDGVRDGLTQAVGELEARAKRVALKPADFEATRAKIVDARLTRALDDLDRNSAEKTVTPVDFKRVENLLEERAETPGPGDAAVTARLQQAIAQLKERSVQDTLSREEFEKLRADLVKRARAATAAAR